MDDKEEFFIMYGDARFNSWADDFLDLKLYSKCDILI